MQLRCVSVSGYRSARHGCPVVLDRLGKFNILIGPNNSGKSTVLRFLEVLAQLVRNEQDIAITIPWSGADTSWWWQGSIDQPIKAVLEFAGPVPAHAVPSDVPGHFEHAGKWRMSVDIRATPHEKPEVCSVLVAPEVYAEDGWRAVVRPSEPGTAGPEYLNRKGQYVLSSSTDTCPYKAASTEIIKAWATGTRFFDPVRAIDRAPGRRGLADGSDLLEQIRAQQLDPKQSHAFSKFRRWLIDELNALLVEPGSGGEIDHFEIKGETQLDLYVGRKGDETPIALQYMGTGIAELTVLMADIMQNPGVKQYFIEEPECHLHPRLVRRLMARLRKVGDAQYFITTHSNAVLDSLTAEDRVYRFGIEPGSGTLVQCCENLIDHGRTLDALGVSGGTLLQTNCVLWVEGPSDRIYLAEWIRRGSVHGDAALTEGSDFSFVFYGGKVLSHFAFADRGADDFVRLVDVCRFSGVVMDSDIGPEEAADAIRDTKGRIKDEAEKDPDHRVAVFSGGREIENDVDIAVFRRAVAKLLNVEPSTMATLELSGKKRYFDEIVDHFGLQGDEAKSMKRKLQDKVTLAELVVDEWTEGAQIPAFVHRLIELIERSRLS